MIECRCGATDGKCLVTKVWVEKASGGGQPTLWFETNSALKVGTFSIYLDANAVVSLVNDLRGALLSLTA